MDRTNPKTSTPFCIVEQEKLRVPGYPQPLTLQALWFDASLVVLTDLRFCRALSI